MIEAVVVWMRRHRVGVLAAGLTVAFVALAGGAFGAGWATAARPVAAPTRTPTPTVTPTVRPTPIGVPASSRLRTCSVATAASDPRLGAFEGRVENASSGEVLFDRSGTTPRQTGSLVKILTAASAMTVLGPDYRIPTTVVQSGQTGIVLVGHGDATLSRTAPGTESWYDGAPKLSDLATQTIQRWVAANPGQQIESLTLDDSYWNDDDAWDPSWPETERTEGYQSLVTALQVDGDRDDPTVDQSPRSTDPVGRAGASFLAALHAADPGGVVAADVAVSPGTAPDGAAQLGEVDSQPVSTLIGQMFRYSDNTLAEMLARISSVKAGAGGSADSLNGVYLKALAQYGVATTGITIRDGSGESDDDQIPPSYLTDLLIKIDQGGQHLDILRDALPVAGQPGSLQNRFTGANAKARGAVAAKTGWLADAYSLAGIIHARDGSTLVFAFYAIGDSMGSTPDGKVALDTLTTAVYSCGDNLANT